MSVEHFAIALGLVAQKKNVSANVVQSAVAACQGPVINATQADVVRFHDDKSTYTGMHAFDHLRSPSKGTGGRMSSKLSPRADVAIELGVAALGVFKAFCSDGAKDLDGRSFTKLCKDSHLLDLHFTATDADLVFATAVPHGQRRMSDEHFAIALGLVAQKKNVSADVVQSAVAACRGPVINATQADVVRFHDDKSTYTGMHAIDHQRSPSKGTGGRQSSKLSCSSNGFSADVAIELNAAVRGVFAAFCQTGSRRPSISSRLGTPLKEVANETVVKSSCGDSVPEPASHSTRIEATNGHEASDDAGLDSAHVGSGFRAVRKIRRSQSNVDITGPVLLGTKANFVQFLDDKHTYTGTHVHGGPVSVAVC